jgi:hypothetical protein
MKVINKLLMFTLVLSVFAGCSKDEKVVEIVLQSPTDNAEIDLSAVDVTKFSWNKVVEVTGYTLKLALSENELASTLKKFDLGNVDSYDFKSQDIDEILDGYSILPGESTDIFWTVISTENVPNIKTQVRKFKVTRIPNLPLQGVAGEYEGTITIVEMGASYPNVTIDITYADNAVVLKIPAGAIPVFPLAINASCTVTSDQEKYSLSGTANVPLPVTENITIPIPVTIKNTSNITKAGKAVFDIEVALPEGVEPGGTLLVKFEGQKK